MNGMVHAANTGRGADQLGAADHIRFASIECKKELLKSLKWLKGADTSVVSGELVATAGSLSQGNEIQLFAPCSGQLQVLQVEEATEEAADETKKQQKQDDAEKQPLRTVVTVAQVRYCTHPLKKKRVCMMCLETVDDDDPSDEQSVNLVLHGQVLQMNAEEATKLDHDKLKRRLDAKKLSLVLDLDHTLLHAVRSVDVLGAIPDLADVHHFFIPGVVMEHVVKLRPGLTKFLSEISKLYDLHIYTHGTRVYAEQMAKILDPKDQFFHDRIVARTDTPDVAHKSLKMLFPSSDDSMIVILDDRKDVWTENADNVLLIEPYHFFKCTAEINNAAGRGVLDIETTTPQQDGEDEFLNKAFNVLKYVHERFYADDYAPTVEEQTSGKGRNVKDILIQRRQMILKHCNIVFSGVFPVGSGRPAETQFLWRLVESLGAKASVSMENFPITHLVLHPARLGTQKHVQARSMADVRVVVPEWIFQCAKEWDHVSEEDFLADTWKQKQEQLARQQQEATSTASASAEAQDSNGQECDHQDGAESSAPDHSSDQKSSPRHKQDPAKTTASPRTSALKKAEESTDAKPKKSVCFSEETKDPSEAHDGASSRKDMDKRPASSLVNRMRVKRPHHNGSNPPSNVLRPGRVHVPKIPEKIGVVASGGTIDFLSKISTMTAAASQKRKNFEEFTASQAKAVAEAAVQRPKQAHKSFDDDAFQKLIAAEEMENEKEQKRKLDSTDVRDQLRNRSLKRSRSDQAESIDRMQPEEEDEEETKEAGDEDADEDELDDLDREIFG